MKKANQFKNKINRILKVTGKIFISLLLLFVLLILFIRSPFGQNIIVNEAVSYVSNKTNTKVDIKKLFVTFDGDIKLDGLYLEDKKGDTLIYSKSLEANIPLWSMIRGQAYGIDNLQWEGLRANFIRKDSINGFNFQFLIDVFATKTDTLKADAPKPFNIVIGDLDFKDIHVVYNDVISGLNSRFNIGKLNLTMESLDMETMTFSANTINLEDSHINMLQNAVLDTKNEEINVLPYLSANILNAENVIVNYKSVPDLLSTDITIETLAAEIPKFNINKNTIEVDNLKLNNSEILVFTQTTDNVITQAIQDANDNKKKITWPKINLDIKNITLNNNIFGYYVNNNKPKNGIFNANALEFKNLNLTGNSLFLKNKNAGIHLGNASFIETSGYHLKNLAVNATITNKKLNIDKLKLKLNDNKINGKALLSYPSLSEFIANPEVSKINIDIPDFKFYLKEIFNFQPALEQNVYLKKLSKKPLTGNIKASGYLSSISMPNLFVNWGNTTRISANGIISNITNPKTLQFNIPNFSAKTIKTDVLAFVSERELGVSLPENIAITGTAKGSLEDIYTKSKLTTSHGIASIDARFNNTNAIVFDALVKIEDYKLNELLQNETLGTLSLTIKANGKGQTINSLDAKVKATVSNFNYNEYAIKDLEVFGNVKNGKGNITSKYKDKNLNLDLNTTVTLDSIAPEAKINLDLIGANLQGLGLMKRDIRTGLKLTADFKGNTKKYAFNAQINDGVVVYDNKTYLLGGINTKGFVRKDTTAVSFKNKIVSIDLQSNTDPQTFGTVIQDHLYSYFYRDAIILDTVANPVNLKLKAHIAQSALLNDVFLVNVKDLDTINIAVDFKQKERKLSTKITVPHINYSDNELDSLAFTLNTTKDDLNFNLGFKAIKAGPIAIQKTIISGDQKNNKMALAITAYNDNKKLINVLSQITGSRDELRFHVLQKELIFNQEPWYIPEGNKMTYTKKHLEFDAFKISRENQSVEITDNIQNSDKEHIALDFLNFNLGDFLSYFNTEKTLASGVINGDLILEEPFKDTGILADVEVSQFEILKADLASLSITGRSLGGNSYAFNTTLKGGAVDLDLVGDYVANENGANLDLDLKLNSFKMQALEKFSQGFIKETDGDFSGNFKVTGTTAEPKYKGKIKFNNANFNITMFNAAFTLANETLNVDNKGLTMSNFTIQDKQNNSLVLTGVVGTKTFLNPTFNLKLKATNFQFLNATKEDNDFLYGTASFDANATLTGDLQIPKLDANVTIGSNTDVTYVMPSAAVNLEQRDGVVVFVNRENPNAILTQTEEQTATIKGFDIKTFLNIGQKATVTIIIDEDTGDYFKVSGHGDFDFRMKPNGAMNLVGIYNIDDGLYEMNLYNLVNRKFRLAPGSKVSWAGDPFDAKLDVRAIYNLKASASPLMAPQTSGADASVRGKYRQVLPFFVYLNIDGELLQPKISFKLDMPENEQGAIGGQVYGRVQQVNQQESELNKQVFSLLVLNRFYPEPGSDGSKGGFATVARDNLNDAVSDQLNIFSNKLLKNSGFELDFGLDSYTDYQGNAPQDRTQLNIAAQKRLFNDRLIVRVGSEVDIQGSSTTGEATPLIGNVSLEYLLTKNGRYKLKGFRRNEFENVIDGQTIVSGIGLIFTQEFNKFSELWEAILYNETKEEKLERERLKAEQKKKDKEKIDPENEKLNKN